MTDSSSRDDWIDRALRCLADGTRRQVLVGLRVDGAAEVDLEDLVAGRSRPTVHRLHHVHLPKLADAGLVDWDRGDGVVVRGPRYEDVAPLLEAIEGVEATTWD